MRCRAFSHLAGHTDSKAPKQSPPCPEPERRTPRREHCLHSLSPAQPGASWSLDFHLPIPGPPVPGGPTRLLQPCAVSPGFSRPVAASSFPSTSRKCCYPQWVGIIRSLGLSFVLGHHCPCCPRSSPRAWLPLEGVPTWPCVWGWGTGQEWPWDALLTV